MRSKKFLGIWVFLAIFATFTGSSSAQSCGVFRINLQGQIGDSYGGNAFQRNGVIVIYSGELGGSGNSVEVWIQSGNPVTAPQVGSIFFASNTALIGSLGSTLRNGQMQLASVQSQRRGQVLAYSIKVTDQFAITQGGMFNVVNLSGGIAADAKLVDAGTINLKVDTQSGQIAGNIVLRVRNWMTTPHQASIVYQATLSGSFAGQSSSCVATSR